MNKYKKINKNIQSKIGVEKQVIKRRVHTG